MLMDMYQIDFLKKVFKNLKSGHILFEYVIPRMGKRVDVILIYSGLVIVIEFKVGAVKFEKSAIDHSFLGLCSRSKKFPKSKS